MANIPRKTQQVFGGSLPAPGNIAVYGSLAQTAPAYSLDLTAIQNPQWVLGLAAALINAPGGLASPALEDLNAVLYVITTQLAYILQNGMAEWDSGTDYQMNAFCRVGNVQYVSIQNSNTNHAVTDTNWWIPYASTLNNSRSLAKAWVTFDGSGNILDQFNVSGVSKTATGCYLVTFQTPMANANYAMAGMVGSGGGAYSGGDDNYVTNGAPGKASVKSNSQCSLFCYDRVDTTTQDPNMMTAIFFGA